VVRILFRGSIGIGEFSTFFCLGAIASCKLLLFIFFNCILHPRYRMLADPITTQENKRNYRRRLLRKCPRTITLHSPFSSRSSPTSTSKTHSTFQHSFEKEARFCNCHSFWSKHDIPRWHYRYSRSPHWC
jgi:hypothetical protein